MKIFLVRRRSVMDNEKDNSAPNFRKKESIEGQSCWDCVFFVYVTGFCIKYRKHIKRAGLYICDDFKEK